MVYELSDCKRVNEMALQRCNVTYFFFQISGLNFGRTILRAEFLEGELFRGPLLLEKRIKNFDPRMRVQNPGVQNSFSRIQPQLQVLEVQTPLCVNLSLKESSKICTTPRIVVAMFNMVL